MLLSGAVMKILTIFYFLFVSLSIGTVPVLSAGYPIPEMDPNAFPAPKTGCLASSKCHAGIEPIRAHNSEMAKRIYDLGQKQGDPNGCVVCHGGNPNEEKDAKNAHTGTPQGTGGHIGPLPDGSIHTEDVKSLREVGRRLKE